MSLAVIIFFLLSGFVSPASASNETLCEALAHHRYPQMGLLSLTWSHYAYGLFIFTRPGYRYYDLPSEKVAYGSIDLSEASPLNMAENDKYTEAFGPVAEQTHRGTYLFALFYPWPPTIYSYKLIFLIVTDNGTRMGTYRRRFNSGFQEITVNSTTLPDFTLAGMVYERAQDLPGFVISADAHHYPGFIILSQYKVYFKGSKVTGLPPPAGQTDDRPFFFLQVMDHPYEVILLHSNNKPDPDAQLLRTVPRSFLYDKKHLVLFDTLNGCVHIINDFADFDVTDSKSRTFKRSNYPFEVYFKCAKPIDNPNPNRCNVVRGSHRPTGVTPKNPVTPSTESVESFSMSPSKIVCMLVVAVLAVGLIVRIVAKNKGKGTKGRSARKSSASSSAISGTSKTGSKRSTVGKSSISSGHGAKSTLKVAKNCQASKTSTSK